MVPLPAVGCSQPQLRVVLFRVGVLVSFWLPLSLSRSFRVGLLSPLMAARVLRMALLFCWVFLVLRCEGR